MDWQRLGRGRGGGMRCVLFCFKNEVEREERGGTIRQQQRGETGRELERV
jgi:hypothetical protein